MRTTLDTTTPVLVLGAGRGGLGVARSLGRLGIPVYAVHDQPGAPALSSRYWQRSFLWDFSGPKDQAVDFLLTVGRDIGRSPLLIATSDKLALFVAEQADALAEAFLFPRTPPGLVSALANKRELISLARQAGVPTPAAVFPRSAAEVWEVAETATFPLMLKGLDPRQPQGKCNAIVHDRADLSRYLADMAPGEVQNIMLQEYIPGGDESVWMFNGYLNARGDCLTAFTGRKIRQWPPYHGAAALGICTANPIVENITRAFLKAVGYRGIVDIGYRYDARDGRYKLLDVNPRIGATFRLFVGADGLDVARAFYMDMTGQPVPATRPSAGRKWLLEEDFISFRQYIRDGHLSWSKWVGSLRGVKETAWFAVDDPTPFFFRVLNRLRRKAGASAAP